MNMLFPAASLGGQLPRSFPQALAAFEQDAKAGDPTACAVMGTLRLFGWGISQDCKEARMFFLSAAARGHARGFTGMGILAARGWGGEPLSHKEAKKMLFRGAEMVSIM